MTILDKINTLLTQAIHTKTLTYPDALYLGILERKAFIAAVNLLMNAAITDDNINGGSFKFKGLDVVPVDLPSYIAVGVICEGKPDESIVK